MATLTLVATDASSVTTTVSVTIPDADMQRIIAAYHTILEAPALSGSAVVQTDPQIINGIVKVLLDTMRQPTYSVEGDKAKAALKPPPTMTWAAAAS